MPCVFCQVGRHYECNSLRKEAGTDFPGVGLFSCCCAVEGNAKEAVVITRGRPPKEGGDMDDVESTGRKRAAVAAPLNKEARCEWAYLKNAGGGVVPIVGCFGNPQTDRHHGPDKSTLNNEVGTNLHRICATCHHRWHAANDEFYGTRPPGGKPFIPLGRDMLPHDSATEATPEEMIAAQALWSIRKDKRDEHGLAAVDGRYGERERDDYSIED